MVFLRSAVVGALCLLGVLGCQQAEKNSTDHPGKATYVKYCANCHNAGVADAPKLGDESAWRHRIEKGRTALLQTTIDGIPPGMPKKGLCMSCSDEQLAESIDYMLAEVDD